MASSTTQVDYTKPFPHEQLTWPVDKAEYLHALGTLLQIGYTRSSLIHSTSLKRSTVNEHDLIISNRPAIEKSFKDKTGISNSYYSEAGMVHYKPFCKTVS